MNVEKQLVLGAGVKIESDVYNLIGIDHYQLMNTLRKPLDWRSFTVTCESERLSFSIMKEEICLWHSCAMYSREKTLICEHSGLALVEFEGNQGPSKPFASLLWFAIDDPQYQYFAVESFIDRDATTPSREDIHYFLGRVLSPEELHILPSSESIK